MRSSKSRSRSKSNRQRTLGNITNRVFDSSGPEGKVRGTPQQIIEKYLTLARDAQLSHDRVAEQSFLQHAEHYTRMLGEANREMADRQGQGDDGGYQSSMGGHGYHQSGQGNGQPSGGQGQNGGHQNNGGQRDQGSRDGGQRDGGQRDGGRDAQPRDHQNRDSQNRDGQNRDGQNRDGQNRDGQNRDYQPRDSQPRDSQPRDSQPRENQPREPRPVRADNRAERSSEGRVDPSDSEQPRLPDFLTSESLSQPVSTPETEAEGKPVRKRSPRQPRAVAAPGDAAAAPVARSRRKPAAATEDAPKASADRDGGGEA